MTVPFVSVPFSLVSLVIGGASGMTLFGGRKAVCFRNISKARPPPTASVEIATTWGRHHGLYVAAYQAVSLTRLVAFTLPIPVAMSQPGVAPNAGW